ncbi:DUF721 domain-containing protein [Thiohalobacter thiocyanaticus]|uniref:DUF721 domain-containing protein n=1 Tax=Thiohalobacter thiocyanaticus TaxID=585455 RepID=A0A426QLB9_9GAMM|nr:DUF721 domain-containing protein [Thiohalobacter thiocyanaticus]RRQ22517.1 DUF721 domain-containing protein [Thiohalobacter thiocyanaticus]
MKTPGTQSIGRYLRGIETSGGVSLRQALTAHAALEQRLLAQLPAPLQAHCRLGQIRNNTLILIVDSAAWATRLRFLTPQLIKQFAGDDSVTVDKLEVRIRPQNQPAAPPPAARSPARLSPENAALITSLARSIGDKKLSQALQRLAGRGSGTNRR